MDKKILALATLIEAGDPAWKQRLIDQWDCLKPLGDFELIRTLLMPVNPGTQSGANLLEPLINGVAIGKFISAYGAGTAYALTNTAAAVNLGTTDPAIVVDEPGTYLVQGYLHVARNGATVVAETATLKTRRTNNTAADIGPAIVVDLPASTTLTDSLEQVAIPAFLYTTTNSDDALSLFGNVSAALGAGSIDIIAIGTALTAQRLF